MRFLLSFRRIDNVYATGMNITWTRVK